jgi:hypothetical protein
MSKIDMTVFDAKLRNLAQLKARVTPQAFKFFHDLTPVAAVKGGNARNSTTLQGNKIVANYEYASVLDAGRGYRDGQMRGSVQAPAGMTAPTQQQLVKLVQQYMATLGTK